uniref:Uncharacterized protein n=1 Tax=Globodera rostochiensis TaxID=31243 RepID=A0A914HT95_GLORO
MQNIVSDRKTRNGLTDGKIADEGKKMKSPSFGAASGKDMTPAMPTNSTCSAPARTFRPPLFRYPALPRFEMALYWAIALTTVGYAWYCVWSASHKWEFRMGQPASVQEFPFVGMRFKDESNWEWFRWSPFALRYLPFLLFHSVLFNLLPMFFNEPVWPVLYIFASMAMSAHIFTLRLLFCSVSQGFFIFACTLIFRHTMAVWLSALPLIYVVMNRTDWVAEDPFLVLLFVSYTLLSFVSFCLELSVQLTSESHRSPTQPQNIPRLIIRMLLYVFYQPYLFTLIVLYPDFEKQLSNRHSNRMPFGALLFKAVRVAFWWLICELSLYFLYFGIIALDTEFMAKLPKNEFVSIGMAMGAFFHLKYVVIFGLPALFANLDGMQPPAGPICISRVALYSKIWRGFDRGLYCFFKEYIFIPICRPTFSLARKLVGIIVSFTFVLLWHGFFPHNIVWIGLNIAEMLIEFGAKAIYAIPSVRQFRIRAISDVAFRRVLGWLQIVPFAFGLYSNFYFLGGGSVGWLFVQRIFWEETVTLRWPFFLLIICGYFYMQVTMEIERKTEKDATNTRKGCPVGGGRPEENGTTTAGGGGKKTN